MSTDPNHADFGYTDTGYGVHRDAKGRWRNSHAMEIAPNRVTPVRVLQPGEVAVIAADAEMLTRPHLDPFGHSTTWMADAARRVVAALAAQSEPSEGARNRDTSAPEPADQGEEPTALYTVVTDAYNQDYVRGNHGGPYPWHMITSDGQPWLNWKDIPKPVTVESTPAPPADRTPDAATLPDTPWTIIRVDFTDGHGTWRTDGTGAWLWWISDAAGIKPVSEADLARVTSFEILAEPPKGDTEPPRIALRQYTDRAITEAVDQLRGEIVAALKHEANGWCGIGTGHYPNTTSQAQYIALANVAYELNANAQSGQQHTEKENDA